MPDSAYYLLDDLVPYSASRPQDEMGPSKELLCRKNVILYGCGHMLNDLTAACWFTYLLVFLTEIGLDPRQAAVVMMAGQLADGLSTLIAGRMIDSYGHFKLWHFWGSVLVVVSFSSVFGGCLICVIMNSTSTSLQTASYSFFAAIFNCGWAATQVSHMSLVNCITANPTSRVALNSCRNAFTMVANLGLYAIAYVAFLTIPSAGTGKVHLQFRWIAGGAIGAGILFVLAFQIGVPEPRLKHTCHAGISRMSWKSWFKKVLYYQIAFIYTLVRLATNVSQALLPIFLISDLALPHSSKASVPGLIYFSSLVTSLIIQEMTWTAYRLKVAFSSGVILWIICGCFLFNVRQHQISLVYFVAVLFGAGNSLALVPATSMEGILVSNNTSGCGFVYGSLSFYDKITCGIALFVVEGINSNTELDCVTPGSDGCQRSVLRWVLACLPATCGILAWLAAMMCDLEEVQDANEGLGVGILPCDGVNNDDLRTVILQNGRGPHDD